MARVVVPEYPHHLTERDNRRQPVFLRDGDCSCYLAEMRTACQRAGTRLLAHCLDVIAEADWLIDLGPEGPPEKVAKTRRKSETARVLKPFLAERRISSN
ncbi:MAG: hypothetical protein U5K99_06185 [Anaerolineales bacterium]|nr:hypothetical protein [Anaerolineales bacterium]